MCAFEPPIHERGLPLELVAGRLAYARESEAVRAILDPRIEGHILVLQNIVDGLVAKHAELVDRSDLDLEGETRWVAMWEMGGRSLALANALLDQLRHGWAAETIGTMRVLHEAANLLEAFLDREDDALVRRWLAGEEIQPREVREQVGAFGRRAVEQARQQGNEIEGDVAEITRQIYAKLSPGAHNQRRGFAESLSRNLRQFATGPHPDTRVRALYVEFAGQVIEQVVLAVGFSFAQIYGGMYFTRNVLPLVREIEAVRDALPIGENVRAELGYA